ncbi:MAG: TonB-dependent receptor, partial [Deltaproteobacteria bacterium]|nr:TonB-dependent receptor [Deltaproteobacteria bacterium]
DVEYEQKGGCWTEPGDLTGTCFYPQIDIQNSNHDDNASPFLALRYKPTEELTAYISVSQGFRSGGYNANLIQEGVPASVVVIDALSYLPTTVTHLDISFDSEETISYEAGVKVLFPSVGVSMNTGLFYIIYDDFVVSEVVGSSFDANSGKAQIRGVEWSADWRPMESLNLKGRVGYLDAKYTRFTTVGGEDFSGNRLTASPEWDLSAQVDYRREIAPGLIGIAHGSYSYVDDYFTSANNDPVLHKSPDTWRIDGKIGVEAQDGKWGVYLWGKNITDESKEEGVGVQSILGLARTQLAVPRSYGIEVLGRF